MVSVKPRHVLKMHLYIHHMYWHAQWAVSAAYIVTDWSQADQALNMIDRSSEGDRVRSWKDWYIQISLISDLEEIYSNAIMRHKNKNTQSCFFFCGGQRVVVTVEIVFVCCLNWHFGDFWVAWQLRHVTCASSPDASDAWQGWGFPTKAVKCTVRIFRDWRWR